MRHFGVDDGLPCSKIYTAMQDSRGYLWICTEQGIARFDGYTFETFGTHTDLPYNDYWGAKEDSKGRIWFSTFNTHFVHYDYADRKFHVKKNRHIKTGKGATGNYCVEDAKGDVWYESSGGQHNVSKDTCIKTKGIDLVELSYRFIHEFIYDKSTLHNKQYFAGYEGKKDLTDTKTTFRDSMLWQSNAGDYVVFINEYTYLAYSSLEKKLYYRSPTLKKEIPIAKLSRFPIAKKVPIAIHVINENEILINTFLECFVIDTNLNRLPQYDFLRNYNINTIAADKEGNHWICTKNDGLYLLSANGAQSHTFSLKKDIDIRAITADKTGRVWIGTSKGDVFFTQGDSSQELFFQKPNNLHIRDLVVTAANTLIIAFEGYNIFYPLSLLAQNKKQVAMDWAEYATEFECNIDTCKTAAFPKDKNKIMVTNDLSMRNFYRKKNEHIMISAPTHGKYIQLYDQIERQEYSSFYTRRRTTACAEAKMNSENAWIGTSIGLFFYWKQTLFTDSLPYLKAKYPILEQPVLDMATDKNGNIWVATDGLGLYRIQSAEDSAWNMAYFQLFEIPELKGKTIKSVFIDSRDHIWAATNQGAWEIIMTQEGKNPQAKVKKYSISQGVPTNEVNCIYADDKYVFIATTKGLTRIPINLAASPKVSFLDLQVQINGKGSVYNKPSVCLSYKENNIRFTFVSQSFKQ